VLLSERRRSHSAPERPGQCSLGRDRMSTLRNGILGLTRSLRKEILADSEAVRAAESAY
jgi:hypothetical protein